MSAGVQRIFVCTNKREKPVSCGLRQDAVGMADHLSGLLAEAGLEVDVRKSRCLGKCQYGPVMGVFPDKAWYTYEDEDDLAEIVSEHLQQGRQVERLTLKLPTPKAA
ncbi:(2Fe-2S) ferredoxin domain-containing protein [Kitasatospora sp. HPMI-4]|uniref:(2Fe-2S) ferredoxin domain-containing protein n=1 Tax=Kitasatospora sp. HPMI-4 TaxID=3448443 RepID=UPI003F1A7DB1